MTHHLAIHIDDKVDMLICDQSVWDNSAIRNLWISADAMQSIPAQELPYWAWQALRDSRDKIDQKLEEMRIRAMRIKSQR